VIKGMLLRGTLISSNLKKVSFEERLPNPVKIVLSDNSFA
jgi:hypothetical protein